MNTRVLRGGAPAVEPGSYKDAATSTARFESWSLAVQPKKPMTEEVYPRFGCDAAGAARPCGARERHAAGV